MRSLLTEHVHEKIYSGEKYAMPGCWFWICATCPEHGNEPMELAGETPLNPLIESVRYYQRYMVVHPEGARWCSRMIYMHRTKKRLYGNEPLPDDFDPMEKI